MVLSIFIGIFISYEENIPLKDGEIKQALEEMGLM